MMTGISVETQSGTLAGAEVDGARIFRGIPYAAPPVGPARWLPPAPPLAWSGTRDATRFGNDPMQPPGKRSTSRAPGNSEDCLFLNVWTPAEGEGPWPVMVWFEGGSFLRGTGANDNVDGTNFTKHGVILVTLNYRLGVFGYLAHPLLTAESPHHASGNYGLMDQLAALRWVKDNIAAFGGDASRVTIFGVSAGSASIGLMLTSPLARGLFDQAILESPGSLRPLCALADAEAAGTVVGNDLAAMRAMPADELLAMNGKIGPPVRGLTTPRILRPIRDGYSVPREESEAYDAGDFAAVPTMIGCTANEGAWGVQEMPINTLAEWTAYMKQNFGDSTDEALGLYPAAGDAEVKHALGLVFGDTQFVYGTRGIARAMSKRQPKTFRYLFAHGPAGHADDTNYIFGTETNDTSPAGKMISDAMMRYWSQFAKTGDPNVAGLPTWPAFDAAADNYLRFGETAIDVGNGWRTPELDFIDRYLRANRSR